MTARARTLTKWIGGKAPHGALLGAAPALMIVHSFLAPVFPWGGWGVLFGFFGIAILVTRVEPMSPGEVRLWEKVFRRGSGKHRSG